MWPDGVVVEPLMSEKKMNVVRRAWRRPMLEVTLIRWKRTFSVKLEGQATGLSSVKRRGDNSIVVVTGI